MANDNSIAAISASINIETKSTINALNNLIKSVTTLNEAANEMSGVKTLVRSLRNISKIEFANLDGLKEVNRTFEAISKIGDAMPKLPNLTQAMGGEKATNTIRKQKTEITETAEKLGLFSEEAESTRTQWDKAVSSFTRIAWYRTVRRIINLVSRAMQEGLQHYARYDAATNATMSNIMNTTNQTKATLGIALANIMQILEPVMSWILQGVTEVTNSVNAMFAAFRGDTSYAKVIKSAKDYRTELEKTSGALASFDRFEVLGGTQPQYELADVESQLSNLGGLGETVVAVFTPLKDIFDGLVDTANALQPAVKGMADVFMPLVKSLGDTVGWIVKMLDKTNLLVPVISALGIAWLAIDFKKKAEDASLLNLQVAIQKDKVLESTQTWEKSQIATALASSELKHLKENTYGVTQEQIRLAEQNLHTAQSQEHLAQQTLKTEQAQLKQQQRTQALNVAMAGLQAVAGAAGLGGSLGDLIKNWSELSTAEKVQRASTMALTAAYTALAIAQMWVQASKLGPVAMIAAGIASSAAVVATIASAMSSVGMFAAGGIPQKGTMFIAGEAGAEWVGNVGGQTGVMNKNQIGDMLTEMRQAAYDGVFNAIQDSGGMGGGNNHQAIPVSSSGLYQLLKVESNRRGNIKIINNTGYLN